MGAILLLFTGFILLAYSLARPPRRIEGALLACMLAGMGLFAYVTWQAKTSEPDPKDVNINTATVAELARATDIPADIAESVVRVRQLHGGFRSLSDVPILGFAGDSARSQINRLAADKKWETLRTIARTGKLPGKRNPKPTEHPYGLFPALDLRMRAVQALPDPPFDLTKSPRTVLLAYIDNEAVVDRIIQFRTLEWEPTAGEILRISDIPAVPLDKVVLRTEKEAYNLYWATIGVLMLAILGVHLYLRAKRPAADEMILPLMGGLGLLGVIMLFSVSSPLKVAAAMPGLPLIYGGSQPKYVGLATAMLLGLIAMPFAHKLTRLIGKNEAQGALVIAVLAPLAANLLARWGTTGLVVLIVVSGIIASSLRKVVPEGAGDSTRAVTFGRYLMAGIIITAAMTIGRLVAGKGGYAPFLEFAKLALIVYTARLCTEHDFFLGGRLRRLPASAVIPFVSVWLVALVLTLLAREMGILLLMWIPCILLLGFAFSWREIAVGLVLLVIGGAIVLWLGIGPFPDRVAMWLDPWNYTPVTDRPYSAQMAQAFHRMASVPSPIAGLGLGKGTPADIATNTQDLVLPLYYEQFGFTGIALVIVMLLALVHRMFRSALAARDRFDHWMALGFAAAYGVQTIYTLGANFGAWPLTGVTLAPLAFGKAACLAAFIMAGALLGITADAGPAGYVPEKRRRTIAWVFAGMSMLGIYAAGKAVKIGVLDKDSNALAHYSSRQTMNSRIRARLAKLERGKILARANSDSYSSVKVLAETKEMTSDRIYRLGPAAWPVVGVSCDFGSTGGEHLWLSRLTGAYDLVNEELGRGPADALEVALLDQWRARHHPLWPARSEWDGKLAPRNVQTTIVSSLQLDAYRRLSDYLEGSVFRSGNRTRKGAILIADVRTGEYLVKVQYPSIDPNVLTSGWKTWDSYASDPSGYLDPNGHIIDLVDHTDRAPGSTAKINTIMALLESGQGNKKFLCKPGIKVNGRVIRDFNEGVHGWVSAEEIIKYSCNRGAAQAAEAVGHRRLLSLYRERLRYELPHMDRPSNVFRSHYEKIAFGQVMSASLRELMTTLCAIGRGGEAIELHLVRKPAEELERWRVCSPETAASLKRYMTSAAKRGGTAYTVYNGAVAWPSKTGSAEVAGAKKTDAWFVGLAPAEKPRVAFVLWVEEDGTGGNMAKNLGLMSLVSRALKATE